MGIYVTCSICGETSKSVLYCHCYELEAERLSEKIKGCTIKDSFITYYYYDMYMIQHLVDTSGKDCYIYIVLNTGTGEAEELYKIKEIDQDQYRFWIRYRDSLKKDSVSSDKEEKKEEIFGPEEDSPLDEEEKEE